MKRLTLTFALLLAIPIPAMADFDEGLQAYFAGDYATALREWRPLAEQGDSDAQFKLGDIQFYGKCAPQNYAEAYKWFSLAAEAGHKNAGYWRRLAVTGMTPTQIAEVVKSYRLAAEQGSASAQYNLGDMYESGLGVPQDYAEAVKWYRRAAKQGDKTA